MDRLFSQLDPASFYLSMAAISAAGAVTAMILLYRLVLTRGLSSTTLNRRQKWSLIFSYIILTVYIAGALLIWSALFINFDLDHTTSNPVIFGLTLVTFTTASIYTAQFVSTSLWELLSPNASAVAQQKPRLFRVFQIGITSGSIAIFTSIFLVGVVRPIADNITNLFWVLLGTVVMSAFIINRESKEEEIVVEEI